MKNEKVKIPYVDDVEIPAERGNDISNRGVTLMGSAGSFRGGRKRLISAMQTYDAIVDVNGHGDYTSIQAALNAGKKRIFVRGGTYTISSTIQISNSDVLIQGEGTNSTVIKIADGANIDAITIGDGATALNSIIIQDIQIDGNKANQTNFSNGVYIHGENGYLINNCSINRCYIHNCYSYGVNCYYSNNNIVSNNQVEDNDQSGLFFQSSTNNTITGNQANNNDNGIVVYDTSTNNAITGNQANNNAHSGIYTGFNSDNTTITGNQTNNNKQGVYLSGSDSNIVDGNQCNNNTSDGIYVVNSDDNVIIGNKASGNAGYGIDIYDSTSDNNYVRINYLTGNTTGSFNDAGTGTIKAADTTNDNVI